MIQNPSNPLSCIALACLMAANAYGQAQPSIPGTWTLAFEENFNGSTVDGAKWRMGGHHSGIAGTGGNAPENITVSGGTLKLKAEQRAVSWGANNYSYATGEISTFANYRQQYGFFETRVKYPAVTGLWPAFWLMPDRGTYGDASVNRRSYLKFDLTGSGISSVTTATLQIKVSSLEAGATNNLMAFKTSDGWTESTINWTNKPVMDPVMLGQKYDNAVVAGDTISIDVTPYVTDQIAGDKIVSMVLADIFMRAKLLSFHSSEAVNAADRPKLVINGTSYTATEDATVRGGSYTSTNYGSAVTLDVKDNWGNTADTFNGGMEIDVLESLGIWGANQVSHAVHWDGYEGSHKSRGWMDIDFPASGDGFHTYGLYWQPGLLEFYVDGVRTGTMEDSRVMSTSAYMILSLQLGGWDYNDAGAQVNNQTMEVDYVRAWTGTRATSTTVTVDNATAADTLAVGTWTTSTSTGGYNGSNYAHDGNTAKGTKTFSFFPPLTAQDDYAIYGRWTSDVNRASNAPLTISAGNWFDYPYTVNQRLNGGSWKLITGLSMAPSTAELKYATTSTDGYVIADAFRLVPAGAKTGAIIVDDADTAKITLTGAWTASSNTSGYYGTGYLHDGNTAKGTKSVRFSPTIPTTKDYFVYARWTSDPSRASTVPIDIVTTAGTQSVLADQRSGGGEWNLLGVYPLAAGTGNITIRTTGTTGHVIADSVMIVPVP